MGWLFEKFYEKFLERDEPESWEIMEGPVECRSIVHDEEELNMLLETSYNLQRWGSPSSGRRRR